MKLLLVDDNRAARDGLRRAIELKTTFDVVGEAADGVEAIALTAALRPDVILMDVRMPVMDGVEATRRIKETNPATYILAVSGSAEPASVAQMLEAGASGYVLKGALPENFLSPLEASTTGHKIRPIEPLHV